MSIYKFKVMYDEDENIYREIEVRPSNSFMELEESIISAWGLPTENTGKFYVSNDRGQKLKTFNHKKPVKTGESAYYPMILNFVEDPHQVFIYESTGKQELGFILELLIIANEKPEKSYPYVVKSYGPSPVKKEDIYKHIAANSLKDDEEEGIDEEDESKLLKEFSSEGEEDVEGVVKEDKVDETGDAAEEDEFAAGDDEEEAEGEESFGTDFPEGGFDEE
jgi:hypothetical protein